MIERGVRMCNDLGWYLECDDFGGATFVIVIGFRRPAGQIVYKVSKSVASRHISSLRNAPPPMFTTTFSHLV